MTASSMTGKIAVLLERIPFPDFLRRLIRQVAERAARIHPLAPLGVALILSYLAAELTLAAFRQPLIYLWPVFGWLSGRDPARLAYYHRLAHVVAFIVAVKVVFETRPIERKLSAALLLLPWFVSSASAHDCSSSSDCENVITCTGWLAAILGLFIGTAVAATQPSPDKKKKCEELRDHPEQFDLDTLQERLAKASPTFRSERERWLARPGAVLNHEIDFDLREDAGGGTTTGSPGDSQRAIIINPIAICMKSDTRDLVSVYIHEFGHVVRGRKGMTAEQEHEAAEKFRREVEGEIYIEPGKDKDPFRPPF